MLLVKDKTAVITGGASIRGLGKAAAKMLAAQGARIAILDLDQKAAEQAAAGIGSEHTGLRCDVTSMDDCKKAVQQLFEKWGQIDILVNNAGITQPLKIMDIEPGNYDAVLDVSLRGTLYMSQCVIPHMRERGSGSIVNMSSVSAQRGGGIVGGPHYSAAKAGILGLTKAMARELAPDGIRCNAICPGLIDTDITVGKLSPEKYEAIVADIPMGRVGNADEVAGCVVFLASSLSGYVTGSEVDVNGGSLIH